MDKKTQKISALTIFLLLPQNINAESKSEFQNFIENETAFRALRQATQLWPSPKQRLEAQIILDEARIDYLYDIGDDIGAIQYQLESGGLRGGDFGSDIINLALRERTPRNITRQKLMELGKQISGDWSCEADANCTLTAEQIEIIEEYRAPFRQTKNSNNELDDSVFDNLRNLIEAEVIAECKQGSNLQQDNGTFLLTENENVKISFGGFNCNWEFGNNPFCGARACVVREYSVSGSDVSLLSEYLE